jgi:hypothetical protein
MIARSKDRIVHREGPWSRPAAWILAAGSVGFISSMLFSSLLHLPRAAFVAAHALVASAFVTCYVTLTRTDPGVETRRHSRRGLLVGVVLGLLLTRGVMMQPRSAAPSGGALTAAIVWFGLVYGMVDAVLLNVLPAHIHLASKAAGTAGSAGGKLKASASALAASLVVTALYHLGFAEFRGPALLQPLIGNAIVTAGYLASGSPLAAIVSHVAMHVAAVVHGMESTVQLPPHY